MRLIGGDDLVGELHPVGLLEWPGDFVVVEEDLQEVRIVRYGAWHVAGRLQTVEVIEDVTPVDLFHVLPGAARCEHVRVRV